MHAAAKGQCAPRCQKHSKLYKGATWRGDGEQSMASGSNGLAVAASSTSTTTEGVGAPTKAGSSGVESLPKEMQDMKIKDDKIDHSDDKVSLSMSFGFIPMSCILAAC